MKDEMLDRLRKYEARIIALKNNVKKIDKRCISYVDIRNEAEALSREWFDYFKNQLESLFHIDEKIKQKYCDKFNKLMRLSRPNNLRKSYSSVLNQICREFKDDLEIPVQQYSFQINSDLDLVNIIKDIPNLDEQEYLRESIECANHGFLKASIVLGWCAVMDHIHKRIEKKGFVSFNKTSTKMKNDKTGRFRRFNKSFEISSINELREVFDSDILWILDGMELIDNNEHKRLRNCFDIRNDCAHPGNAPVKKPNLVSFYSDISEIVFKNDKFIID